MTDEKKERKKRREAKIKSHTVVAYFRSNSKRKSVISIDASSSIHKVGFI